MPASAADAFAENIVLLDVGEAKLMSPFFLLEELRQVPGLEEARFLDPYGGGQGNSIRYMSVALREDSMRARGFENLFLGGEKAGFFIGHTEAITTGSLAGCNAARHGAGACSKDFLVLPRSLAAGELLAYAQEAITEEFGTARRFTFAGGEFFQRMKDLNLYTADREEIRRRVEKAGLLDVYNRM